MAEIVNALREALGVPSVLGAAEVAEMLAPVGRQFGAPVALVRPRSTAEVSAVLKIAHAAGQPVVPWGGRTGLVDGCRADGAVALSLERMNAIEEIKPENATMRVQAGCILQTACEAAEAGGLFLPLDLGARGSATIGGTISTNAGGNRVLRYGMMRAMVLGIEAVLADGTVIDAMSPLMKNNAGYDLKQLFIGSEGTLGIVTRAVLRLRPSPASSNVAFLGVPSFDCLPLLLRRLERGTGELLSAFEVMWSDFYRLVTTAPAKGRAPLRHGQPFYVLVESLGANPDADAARFEQVLGEALEAGEIVDAAIAKSTAERSAMWALRDDVGQVLRNGPIFAFDVSLKISDMEAYVADVRSLLHERWGSERLSLMVFGHLGDGNLHLIVGVGDSSAEARHEVETLVYRPLRTRGGSISAEHGIGLQKRDYLNWSRSPAEIALMRTLKHALDPGNILNPGKVVAEVA
ncbi:MAG: FAD-binding oxidoreductase [Alphaproteobacteria bacterium]|nr:FAD-binding oxidoreductase [Alphaproteobacteria bacterium]